MLGEAAPQTLSGAPCNSCVGDMFWRLMTSPPSPLGKAGCPTPQADWRTIFSRTAPLIADIGFGDGRATAALAAAHPECDHVAFEVHPPGVGALMNRLSSQKLQNVRIVQDDVSLMLPLLFTPNALSGVNIFFPDPWKKRRQHKRRLVDDTFIAMLAVYMAGGGVIHIATDNTDYAQSIALILPPKMLLPLCPTMKPKNADAPGRKQNLKRAPSLRPPHQRITI